MFLCSKLLYRKFSLYVKISTVYLKNCLIVNKIKVKQLITECCLGVVFVLQQGFLNWTETPGGALCDGLLEVCEQGAKTLFICIFSGEGNFHQNLKGDCDPKNVTCVTNVKIQKEKNHKATKSMWGIKPQLKEKLQKLILEMNAKPLANDKNNKNANM